MADLTDRVSDLTEKVRILSINSERIDRVEREIRENQTAIDRIETLSDEVTQLRASVSALLELRGRLEGIGKFAASCVAIVVAIAGWILSQVPALNTRSAVSEQQIIDIKALLVTMRPSVAALAPAPLGSVTNPPGQILSDRDIQAIVAALQAQSLHSPSPVASALVPSATQPPVSASGKTP